MQYGCIAELTHIVVLYFLLHRLLELFEVMLEMRMTLERMKSCEITHSTTAVAAVACFDG